MERNWDHYYDKGKNYFKIFETTNKKTMQESVASRTHQILDLLATAKSHEAIFNRTEVLNAHLNKYPEAKHFAVKVGT